MIREKVRNYLIRNVLCSVISEDVFHVEHSLPFLGNEQLSMEEIKMLKEEIRFLENTRIWHIITNTLASDAQEKMITKSQSFNDMLSGKMLLYGISVQKNIMRKIKEFAQFAKK